MLKASLYLKVFFLLVPGQHAYTAKATLHVQIPKFQLHKITSHRIWGWGAIYICVDGERHLVFQLERLRNAKTWNVNGLFKAARDPSVQLFSMCDDKAGWVHKTCSGSFRTDDTKENRGLWKRSGNIMTHDQNWKLQQFYHSAHTIFSTHEQQYYWCLNISLSHHSLSHQTSYTSRPSNSDSEYYNNW